MLNIAIVDDTPAARLDAQELLERKLKDSQPVIYQIEDYPQFGITPICQELAVLDAKLRYNQGRTLDVVVLDLNLGQSAGDGFKVYSSVGHCLPNVGFVINSKQFDDVATSIAARQLGLRFGCDKNSPELSNLVLAAAAVGRMKSDTFGWAYDYFRKPITPCGGMIRHHSLELLQQLIAFGLSYTGSSKDVDFELIKSIEELANVCYQAITAEHIKLVNRRNSHPDAGDEDADGFEKWLTGVGRHTNLRERVERSLAETDQLVTFR